jgi:hypothetical protein
MHNDFIFMTDFNGSKYKIDYDGHSISHVESGYHKQRPITVLLKPSRTLVEVLVVFPIRWGFA